MNNKSANRLIKLGGIMDLVLILMMCLLSYFNIPKEIWDLLLVLTGLSVGIILSPYISVILDHFAEKKEQTKE